MIFEDRFSLYFAVDWKKSPQYSQLSFMTAGSCSCGGGWDGNVVEAQVIQATSVLPQGPFLDRSAQQAESGSARRASHT